MSHSEVTKGTKSLAAMLAEALTRKPTLAGETGNMTTTEIAAALNYSPGKAGMLVRQAVLAGTMEYAGREPRQLITQEWRGMPVYRIKKAK